MPALSLEELLAAELGTVTLWCSPSVAARAAERFRTTPANPLAPISPATDTLIAVGGGELLDRAKLAARSIVGRRVRLVAIPSVWGSGAEASSIVVVNAGLEKKISRDASFLPDDFVYWPELASTLSPERAADACGDVWAHAVEGLLSPLASAAVRHALGELIGRIASLEIGNDPRWFAESGEACRLQSQSGVGLVHAVAHVLEGPLRQSDPSGDWGHAKLCSTYLLPVLRLQAARYPSGNALMEMHGVDPLAVHARAKGLFNLERFQRTLAALSELWVTVVRDPCARMNSFVVRPDLLDHFRGFAP